MKKLEEISCKVLSYCDIPENINCTGCLSETSPDTYIKLSVTSKKDQKKYDDDFSLDNWIIKNYPELEGKDILIHIDY